MNIRKKNRHLNRVKLFFLISAGIFFLAVFFAYSQRNPYQINAIANTYYVSTSGNDSNPGSQASPFKTFTKAMSVLQAGDTLFILGGTYSEQLIVTKSGTSGSPITIKSVSGQRVILDSANNNDTTILVPANISNVVLSGIEATRSTMQCALIRGSNIVLDNMDTYNCRTFGYRFTGPSETLRNSKCHDNVTENAGGGNTSGGWGSCVKSGPGSSNLIFHNNHIYNNWGEGLIIGQAAGAQAYDNLIHDNFSINIYIGNSYDVDVYRNMTYSKNLTYYRAGLPANCISASEELISGWGAQLHNIRVFNNIANGCKFGMGYTYSEVSGNGCENCLFAYNTIVNSGGIKVIDGPKNSVTIRNNIVSGPISVPANSVIDHNLTGDPHFAQVPGIDPITFRLRSDSPAINAGVAINGIATDFENKNRGSQTDIGAIEYQAGSITSVPSPTTTAVRIGDANGDRLVNILDYSILSSFFGQTRTGGYSIGDFNLDGTVNLLDYSLLSSNYDR